MLGGNEGFVPGPELNELSLDVGRSPDGFRCVGRVRQVAEDPDVVVLREGEEDFREPRHSIVGCSCNNDPTSLSRYQCCDEGSDEGLPGAGSRLDGRDVVLSQSKGDRSAFEGPRWPSLGAPSAVRRWLRMFGLACSCPCAEVVDDGGRMVRLS